VTIFEDSGTHLTGVDVESLRLTSAGPITDATDVDVAGEAVFDAGDQAITLGDGPNDTTNFGSLQLLGGDVTIFEDSGTHLTGVDVESLRLTSAGPITDATDIDVAGEAVFDAGDQAITLGDGANDRTNFGSLQLIGGDVTVFEDSATLLLGAYARGTLAVASANDVVIDGGPVRADGALTLETPSDLYVNDSLPAGISEVVGGTIDATAGGEIHIENGAVLQSTEGGTIGKVTNAPPLLRIGEADPDKALTPSDRVQELAGTVGGIVSEGDHWEQGANFTVTVVWDDGIRNVITGIDAGERWTVHVGEDGSIVTQSVDAGIGSGPAELLLTREYPNTHLSTVSLNVTAQVAASNDPNIRLSDSRRIDLNRVDASVSTRVTGNEFGRVALAVERDEAVVIAAPEPIVAPPEVRIPPPQQINRIEEIRPPRETVVEEGRELYIVKVLPDGTEVEKQILPADALADTEALFEMFRKKGLPDGHYRIYLKEEGFPPRKLMEFYKSGDTFGEPVREPGRGSKPIPEQGTDLRRERHFQIEAMARWETDPAGETPATMQGTAESPADTPSDTAEKEIDRWEQAGTPAVSADGDEDPTFDEASHEDEYSANVFESPGMLRRLLFGAALPAGTILAARLTRGRWASSVDQAMEDANDDSFTRISRLRRRFRR